MSAPVERLERGDGLASGGIDGGDGHDRNDILRASNHSSSTSFNFNSIVKGNTMSVRRTLLLFVCLLMPISLFAQSSTGSVSGSVTDDSGAALPGVTVTTENAATGATRSAVTNGTGYYQVGLLPPGRYTVTAALDGFQSVRRDSHGQHRHRRPR